MSLVSPLMILAHAGASQQEQIRAIIILIVLGLLVRGISIPLLYGKIWPNVS